MATDSKLDIFAVLNHINKKDSGWYSRLQADQKKQLQPFVIARWATGTSDAKQVYFMNELVNRYAFSLGQEKELLWQLLTIASSGKSQRYSWIKGPSRPTTGKSNILKVIQQRYGYSVREALDVVPLLYKEDVLNMAYDLGWAGEEITKLKKEVKDLPSNGDHVQERTATPSNDLFSY